MKAIAHCHPERPHYGKGLCKPCYGRQYAKKHRKQVAAINRARYHALQGTERQTRLDKAWATQIKRLYGISVEGYNALLKKQKGRCVLCNRKPFAGRRLSVDHCHETQIVRGLLCARCNSVLGWVENKEWMHGALRYLERQTSSGD